MPGIPRQCLVDQPAHHGTRHVEDRAQRKPAREHIRPSLRLTDQPQPRNPQPSMRLRHNRHRVAQCEATTLPCGRTARMRDLAVRRADESRTKAGMSIPGLRAKQTPRV